MKKIEQAPEPSSQYLNVQPDHGWADSGGWVVSSEVTISFGSFSATAKVQPRHLGNCQIELHKAR